MTSLWQKGGEGNPWQQAREWLVSLSACLFVCWLLDDFIPLGKCVCVDGMGVCQGQDNWCKRRRGAMSLEGAGCPPLQHRQKPVPLVSKTYPSGHPLNQSAHVREAVETGAESKCGRNVDKDPSGDKTGKADDPGRDCGWRRRLRLSIERPGQCQSQDMSPAVVCFLRIPLHSWVYCLLTEAKEPVARESMSIADDGKELGQTGETTGCRDRCDRFMALPTNTGQRPHRDGGDGVLPEADPLTRPALATGDR